VLYLLTATGARPEAWAICERLMERQDYAGPVVWVIVDDGPDPQPISFRKKGWQVQIISPRPLWQDGQNTQARNLLAGLNVIPSEASIVIAEDDDWYAPDWLTVCDNALQHVELVGEAPARYYNVAQLRWRVMGGIKHASLCATAMRGSTLSTFRQVCETREKFIDMTLWRSTRDKRLVEGRRVVGIKGLPGRPGIGIGHYKQFNGTADPEGDVLREWIGDDADLYLAHRHAASGQVVAATG